MLSRFKLFSMKTPIEIIIEAGGGVSQLAYKLKISKGAVSQWHRVPIARALDVERITGIPRSKLRPDIFGKNPEPTKQQEPA
jgi:DNA-binding transcriptional regulator YdaS (Cro superfamily)